MKSTKVKKNRGSVNIEITNGSKSDKTKENLFSLFRFLLQFEYFKTIQIKSKTFKSRTNLINYVLFFTL